MKIKIPFLLSLFLLASCHKDDEKTPEPQEPACSILVYIAAENNLNNFSVSDIDEMKIASKSLKDRQNLIAYIDRAGNNPPFFARIKNGQFVDSVSVEESLSADPSTLEKALQYVRTNYPAESYGLVLWGHGSGWLVSNDSVTYNRSRAYGGDTGTGSSSGSGKYWMNIPSMARAIKNGMEGTPLKFIMGDCCSFGCVEIAYELRLLTDYIIGSPAEIPDDGAPFQLIIPDMFGTNASFYESVIDHYYNYYSDEYKNKPYRYYNKNTGDLEGYSVPLAAIKTSELDHLAQATSQILTTIADKLTPDGSLNLTDVTYYAIYGSNRYSYDINNVLKNNASPNDYNIWLNAYHQAVPYHRYSQKWLTAYSSLATSMSTFEPEGSSCGAVSMFFPNTAYSNTSPNWNTSIQQLQWNNIIRWQQYGW